jgi:hypothetical protein
MKLKVDKSESYNWSIVVDEKELRRLDEIIKEALKDGTELRLEYNIKFSDGSLIETSDINEIVSEENPKNRQIKNIGISASSEKLSKKISISLGEKYWGKIVTYSISGDSRDWVYLTSSKIEERIKNLKQWYSIIPKIDPFLIIISIIMLIQFYAVLQPKKETTKGVTIFEFSEIIFILLIAFGLLILTYKLIKRGYSYLFPLVVFRIGDGIKCHDDIVKLRGQILWVIISLIVSVSAGLMILKITS